MFRAGSRPLEAVEKVSAAEAPFQASESLPVDKVPLRPKFPRLSEGAKGGKS